MLKFFYIFILSALFISRSFADVLPHKIVLKTYDIRDSYSRTGKQLTSKDKIKKASLADTADLVSFDQKDHSILRFYRLQNVGNESQEIDTLEIQFKSYEEALRMKNTLMSGRVTSLAYPSRVFAEAISGEVVLGFKD
jgi:hypothetical protein